jgi:hypothetical protein
MSNLTLITGPTAEEKVEEIDALIEQFNKMTGLLQEL